MDCTPNCALHGRQQEAQMSVVFACAVGACSQHDWQQPHLCRRVGRAPSRPHPLSAPAQHVCCLAAAAAVAGLLTWRTRTVCHCLLTGVTSSTGLSLQRRHVCLTPGETHTEKQRGTGSCRQQQGTAQSQQQQQQPAMSRPYVNSWKQPQCSHCSKESWRVCVQDLDWQHGSSMF